MFLNELKNIPYNKKKIRQFGVLLTVLAGIIAFLLYRKEIHGYPYAILCAVLLILTTAFKPVFLKPFYMIWMGISIVLGWCMTLIIMTVIFYLLLTPISFIARLSRKTFFAYKPDSSSDTYWNDRSGEDFTKEYYEKQF